MTALSAVQTTALHYIAKAGTLPSGSPATWRSLIKRGLVVTSNGYRTVTLTDAGRLAIGEPAPAPAAPSVESQVALATVARTVTTTPTTAETIASGTVYPLDLVRALLGKLELAGCVLETAAGWVLADNQDEVDAAVAAHEQNLGDNYEALTGRDF